MIPVILFLSAHLSWKVCSHLYQGVCRRAMVDLQWAEATCSYLQLSHSSEQTVNYATADSVFDDFPFLFISKICILRKQTALQVQQCFSCLCRKWEPCHWFQREQRWIQRQSWMRLSSHISVGLNFQLFSHHYFPPSPPSFALIVPPRDRVTEVLPKEANNSKATLIVILKKRLFPFWEKMSN